MRENSCAKADATDTQKKRRRREAVVWVLDETGYHAVPLEEYEAREKIENTSSDTSSKAVIKASKKEAPVKETSTKETPRITVPPPKPTDHTVEVNLPPPAAATEPIPETYTVQEVMTILRLGRSAAYNLVHSKAFPVVRIGHLLRIPKSSFNEWLSSSPVVFM
jgi:excisionase family DNA binding protein